MSISVHYPQAIAPLAIEKSHLGWGQRLRQTVQLLLHGCLWSRLHCHVTKAIQETLNIYRAVQVSESAEKSWDLYAMTIMRATGASRSDAERLLNAARESYAIWPVERDIRLRDVIHYLVVMDLFEKDETKATNVNLVELVRAAVPISL